MKKILTNSIAYICLLLLINATSSHAQWVQVASPPSNFITDHTIGFALDGKGYLVTGTDQSGNIRDDFYQYDPVTDEFTQLDDFPGGARGFSIGDTWGGKAYIGFGRAGGTSLNDLWEYDPTTEEWTELASCPCEARFHPAFIAHNDKVFVGLGGGNFGNLNDWWIYDIATDTWEQGTNFPSSVRHHPYQFAMGDYIYAGLGHGASIYNTWYRYDPSTDSWDQMESLPGEGRVAGQQFDWNGKGYILSGEGNDHLAMQEGEFWEYDPATDSWTEMPAHPSTSRWAPASFVIENEVYLFNGIVYGFGPPESVEEAYKYNLAPLSSTEDLDKTLDLKVYPNPARDLLVIEGKGNLVPTGTYRILDVLGNEMMSFEANGKMELDISNLSNGVYILSAKEETGSLRFVVAR